MTKLSVFPISEIPGIRSDITLSNGTLIKQVIWGVGDTIEFNGVSYVVQSIGTFWNAMVSIKQEDTLDKSKLPCWQSHKQVRASKIVEITEPESGYRYAVLECGQRVPLTADLTARYWPQVSDYIVVYEDGYVSISPAKPFEDGYTQID